MNDMLTVIGAGTTIIGDISSSEDLTVEGRIEGSVEVAGTLIIENGGSVHSNIQVGNAIISGELTGDVDAAGTVRIAEGGLVAGDIKAEGVVISDGAIFRGNIDMSSTSTPSDRSRARIDEKPKLPTTRSTRKTAPIVAQPAKSQRRPGRPRPTAKPTPIAVETVRQAPKGAPVPRIRSVSKATATKKR